MALLGSMEAGEQQLKLRQAALAHTLQVAQTAEVKHAAEAKRLQEHYGYPGDDTEDTGSAVGRQPAPQRRLHSYEESAVSGRAGRATQLKAELRTVSGESTKRTVTPEESTRARHVQDAEPEDTAESEALLLKIDAVAPIGRWPDWAVSMLRARKFTSHQEVRTARRRFRTPIMLTGVCAFVLWHLYAGACSRYLHVRQWCETRRSQRVAAYAVPYRTRCGR